MIYVKYTIMVLYASVTIWLYTSTKYKRFKKLLTRKEALKRYLICLALFGVPAVYIYGMTYILRILNRS